MNKNRELFDVEFDQGYLEKISGVREENRHLLPVFLTPRKKGMGLSKADFKDWWSGRRIPASRNGIKELQWKLDNIRLDELSEKSLGLSLSDHYWIRPSEGVRWEDVNFFDNEFSDDIGNLLITGDWNGGSFMSPDNTSDGVVKKRWKIINGERFLLKGSSSEFTQTEPFRELFASKIAKTLFGAKAKDLVVPYHLIRDITDQGPVVYSACPNFVTKDTEYVSFNQINGTYKKRNEISAFDYCKEFYGDKEYVLDLILILDYIVLNEDRHFGNFGLLRDSDTGNWAGPAPVFDTGSSLFHSSRVIRLSSVNCKPFRPKFDEQIKLIGVSKYYDEIKEVQKNHEQIFYDSFQDCFEDEARLDSMLKIVKEQIDSLLQGSLRKSDIF